MNVYIVLLSIHLSGFMVFSNVITQDPFDCEAEKPNDFGKAVSVFFNILPGARLSKPLCKVIKSFVSSPKCNVPNRSSIKPVGPEPALKCGKSSIKEITPGFGNLMAKDNRAKLGEFPWHAAIYLKTKQKDDLICAANIISPRALVTAAHCFFNENSLRNTRDFLVAVGKLNFQRNQTDNMTQFHDIMKIITHPSYIHPENRNDLAIVITQKKITFNDMVLDICLPFSDENITLEESSLDTVGWNADGSGMTSNDELRTTTYPYISNQDCKAALTDDSRRYLTQERYCTGKFIDPTIDRGDIGGGLALKLNNTYYLVGVINVFLENPPNLVFCTDIRSFYTWIHDEISKIDDHRTK